MKRVLFALMALGIFYVPASSFAGDLTFTKGNKCGQYCYGKGVNRTCEVFCQGDKVHGTTMIPMAMHSGLYITEVLKNGVNVKNKSGTVKGHFDYGTFAKRQ